jgi:hypothetical protein
MSPVGFDPTIPASERPKTHALDRTATVNGRYRDMLIFLNTIYYCRLSYVLAFNAEHSKEKFV